MSWLEPVAIKVEETLVGPVARRNKEDEEQYRAIDARSVKVICEEEEGDYEARGE